MGAAPECVIAERPIELWRFYVARAGHGRGIAQELMRRVQEEVALRGATAVWLGVWERNPRAIAFYGKSGFRERGLMREMRERSKPLDTGPLP